MGRGGSRIGAGRKSEPNSVRSKRRQRQQATVLQHPSSPPPASTFPHVPTTDPASPIEEFDAPNDLTADERSVWLKQAPHAFANRTLTRASAMAFERYCKVVVLERNESKSSGMGGSNHRGLLKQINELEKQFMLTPTGKPMFEAAPPVPQADSDDAFFGGAGLR